MVMIIMFLVVMVIMMGVVIVLVVMIIIIFVMMIIMVWMVIMMMLIYAAMHPSILFDRTNRKRTFVDQPKARILCDVSIQ